MKKLMTLVMTTCMLLLVGCNTDSQNEQTQNDYVTKEEFKKTIDSLSDIINDIPVPSPHYETNVPDQTLSASAKLPSIKRYIGLNWEELINSKVWVFFSYPQKLAKEAPDYWGNDYKIRDICCESGLFQQFAVDDDKRSVGHQKISCMMCCGSDRQDQDKDSCLYYVNRDPLKLSMKESRKFIDNVVYKIFSDQQLQEIVYGLAMPKYKKAFLQLPSNFQEYYLEGLKHAREYVRNFNYKEELAWSENNGWFVTYDSYEDQKANIRDPYRKIDAFIFRRIHKKQMTIEQVKKWLDRIDAEVKSWTVYY